MNWLRWVKGRQNTGYEKMPNETLRVTANLHSTSKELAQLATSIHEKVQRYDV